MSGLPLLAPRAPDTHATRIAGWTALAQTLRDTALDAQAFERSSLGKVTPLAAVRIFISNTKAQDDAFEICVEAYLATQPILQCQET